MTSAFHCQNSRRLPLWGRSARKKLPVQNHLVGLGRLLALAAYIRASVGVNSGRSA